MRPTLMVQTLLAGSLLSLAGSDTHLGTAQPGPLPTGPNVTPGPRFVVKVYSFQALDETGGTGSTRTKSFSHFARRNTPSTPKKNGASILTTANHSILLHGIILPERIGRSLGQRSNSPCRAL